MRSRTIFLLLLVAAACARHNETRSPVYRSAPVILISIDTLRADHLPLYGYRSVETSAIDRLARDGIVFEHCWAHSPMTLPSHVSMLTGLLPPEHGVRDNVGFTFDPAKTRSLPAALASSGYRTGAAVSSYVLRGETGMAGMFGFYDDAIDPRHQALFREFQRPGGATVDAALPWIHRNATAPFFFFLHLYEPHVPYDPPEPFRTRYASNLYDGEIATADSIVGRFLDDLRALGIYDRALIILTSDHGEGLGDHGEQQHSVLLYSEEVRVPLVVKLPGGERKGTRFTTNAQLADLTPTILALTGVEAPPTPHAAALFGSPATDRPIYSESYYARLHLGWSELRSIAAGAFHYIAGARAELFDVTRDPHEKSDIASSDRRTANRLRQELEQFPAQLPAPAAVDPETARALESLGYLASSGQSAGGTLPDPRDRIADFEGLREALSAIASGREADGRRRFDAIVAANPDMPEAWSQLGDTYGRLGRIDEALSAYREALRRSRGIPDETALSMADLELQKGDVGAAQKLVDSVKGRSPRRAESALVRIAIARHDLDSAEAHARNLADAPDARPSDVLQLAEVRLLRGDASGALNLVERAEAVGREHGQPAVAGADYFRGEILARSNRPQEARAAFIRAITAFPDDTRAWSHLAVLEFVLGSRDAARQTIDRMCAANPNPAAWRVAAKTLDSIEDPAGAAVWKRKADGR